MLLLLPFFGVAVIAPLYAVALMQEHGRPAVSQEALRKESERLWKVYQQQNLKTSSSQI
uniref:Uncharacterized protein n=1 Tax=Arundo donax TaxID=35708 RepID=A0A0A8Y7A8_ARUDO